ncbi:MAG: DUF488 family protein [Phycisphaerales bacterium]|jgi:uncharacterized protein YeaO (DUF488 family)|nr:DUF488 family protein [Phycisphaerales bacterium]
MIKIKHLMDVAEEDDGKRLWVEPVGLTRDLVEWCRVDLLLMHLGPPKKLWNWFGNHPDGYEAFRGDYHEFLNKSQYKPALQQLACAMSREDFTLLHQGDDPEHNTATALYEYLCELSAYCEPES